MQKSPRSIEAAHPSQRASSSGMLRITHSTDEGPSLSMAVVRDPTPDLLDRALAGWERFLDSFEEPPHE
ncbi:hypothetical protein GCM10010302_47130 [Streptomyces polychromogenes]|uniref:Uncharacterized protein n=1 Tax=Streptomyces polychromogenes TaxID=67342 RepID=A0ABP3F743_9ACTN